MVWDTQELPLAIITLKSNGILKRKPMTVIGNDLHRRNTVEFFNRGHQA
jgi:hypothetical protein